jgi:uncharacterized membrane protein
MCSRCDRRAHFSIAFYATTMATGVAFAYLGAYQIGATVVLVLPYLYIRYVLN